MLNLLFRLSTRSVILGLLVTLATIEALLFLLGLWFMT